MTRQTLVALNAFALLATLACSETPSGKSALATGPTIGGTVAKAKAALGSPGTTQFYQNGAGSVKVINETGADAPFLFVVFNANDPSNQKDMGHSTVVIPAGGWAIITTGVHRAPDDPLCKPIVLQPDVFINAPAVGPNGKYTLGELANYLYGGGGYGSLPVEDPGSCTVTPPPPPPPPTMCVPFTVQHVFLDTDWIMTTTAEYPPSGIPGVWPYPSFIEPRSLAIEGDIPAGTYHFWAEDDDPFHLSAPDDSDDNTDERSRFHFYPSQLETISTKDIPSDQTSIETDLLTLTFAETQTYVAVFHAGPAKGKPADSHRPRRLKWTKVCPVS